MKRIGVVANCSKPQAGQVLSRVEAEARRLNLTLAVCDETHTLLPQATRVAPVAFAQAVDGVLALGGDGTMLHTVRLLDGAATPVLGVNLGSLGFMTHVTEPELEQALQFLAEGRFTVAERAMLQASVVRDGQRVARLMALNDIVVGWGQSSRAMTLGLSVDDEEVAQYLCDGLIVSTPTGSTGHALSSGGPIVMPAAPVFNMNVICPHSLSARPLILPDTCTIQVQVQQLPAEKAPLLSADGQDEFVLVQGDLLEIARHPQPALFAQLPGHRYFAVLRHKLHWRGSAR